MGAIYNKPALTIEQQLTLLESRGMIVADRSAAMTALQRIGYYRLSSYWFSFRAVEVNNGTLVRLDSYQPNTRFETVAQLYEFDRKLRGLLLDAVGRVEVALRASCTYHFAHEHGAFGHTDPQHFRRSFDHQAWLARVDDEVLRSEEAFVAHFRERYDGFPRVPLWMATEVMSFGTLVRMMRNASTASQRAMAQQFGVSREVLGSWALTISVLRNLCAHHARVWNRVFGVRPMLPNVDRRWQGLAPDRLFVVLLVLRQLSENDIVCREWMAQIEKLLAPVAVGQNTRSMGLPLDWQHHPLWK